MLYSPFSPTVVAAQSVGENRKCNSVTYCVPWLEYMVCVWVAGKTVIPIYQHFEDKALYNKGNQPYFSLYAITNHMLLTMGPNIVQSDVACCLMNTSI